MGKLTIVTTKGPEKPELAIIPFVIATAAQASNHEVVMIFQSASVELLVKDRAGEVIAASFPPLASLIDLFVEQGGKLFLCSPCMKERGIKIEDMVEGSTVIAAGTVVNEVFNSDKVLSY